MTANHPLEEEMNYLNMMEQFSAVQAGTIGTGQNDTRLKDFLKEITQFGRDSAMGKDALPKLAMRVVEAAHNGIITSTPDPNKGEDDAARIYRAYLEAESSKAIHEHDVGGVKANASKLRQLVKLGEMTTCDPQAVMERTIEVRKNAKAVAGMKVKAVYPAMVDVARKQLSKDHFERDLSDDEIRECVVKKPAADKELEKELSKLCDRLEEIISGKNKHGLQDRHELTVKAYESLRERLSPADLAEDEV